MVEAHASPTTPPCLRQAQAPYPIVPLPFRSVAPLSRCPAQMLRSDHPQRRQWTGE
ncbi:MAG: hypothetical protein AAGF95_14360 [Chloroflexota bacterium]